MSRNKKEKTLLERVLDREKVDLAKFTIKEIEQVIEQLVDYRLQSLKIKQVAKLNSVIIKAASKVNELLEK